MTPQGREIRDLLVAANLRERGRGATMTTDRDSVRDPWVTRIDWQGGDPGRAEGLRRCAETLTAAGFEVAIGGEWVCLHAWRLPEPTRDPALPWAAEPTVPDPMPGSRRFRLP